MINERVVDEKIIGHHLLWGKESYPRTFVQISAGVICGHSLFVISGGLFF